jgi:hypothetical protein
VLSCSLRESSFSAPRPFFMPQTAEKPQDERRGARESTMLYRDRCPVPEPSRAPVGSIHRYREAFELAMEACLGVRYPRVRKDLWGKDGKMKPRDLKKEAPYLGVLLLVAIVFIVVRSLL